MPLAISQDAYNALTPIAPEVQVVDPYAIPVSQPSPSQYFGLPIQPRTSYFGRQNRIDPFKMQQQAEEMRIKRQASEDAERLAQNLLGIDPKAEDYPTRRLQAIQSAPLALEDPRGKTYLDAYDKANEAYRPRAEVRNRDEDILGDVAELGATEEQLAALQAGGRVDRLKARALKGELERKLKPVKDTQIRDLQDRYKFMQNEGTGSPEELAAIQAQLRSLYAGTPVPVVPAAPQTFITPKGFKVTKIQ